MSDITNVFKATVKTVKVREKALGVIIPGSDKCIFPSGHKSRSDFTVHTQDVVLAICKLRDFLLEHRKDYLNTTGHLSGESSKLSDRDRDQIDADAKVYIKKCSDAIFQLKSQAHNHKVLPQVKEHKEAVLDLVETFLKGVCQLYSEQQAVRVKRVVDRKRLSRLEPVLSSSGHHSKINGISTGKSSDEKPVVTDASIQPVNSRDNVPVVQPTNGLPMDDDSAVISEEEERLLQLENQQLYDEMSSMVDEVRQIEGRIVEIARLQEIFADKVLDQDKDINKIADTIVGTTENIKEGNEQIRQAMKNNAAFRIWILFFLIVCTLSLLFLDWYNA